jgi:hypothetical protein
MSDTRLSPEREAAIRARPREWMPLEKWGPVCAGCGAAEYRIDGYCSISCRDYHGDEDVIDLLAELTHLRAEIERLRGEHDARLAMVQYAIEAKIRQALKAGVEVIEVDAV